MNKIEKLIAKDSIKTQLYLYCRGVDHEDWALVRSCFGDEHLHKHGSFSGSVDEFLTFLKQIRTNVKRSQHSVTNVIFNFSEDGERATTEANFDAVHVINESLASFLGFESEGNNVDWVVAGTYSDEWVFRDDKWLIVQRTGKHHFEQFDIARELQVRTPESDD